MMALSALDPVYLEKIFGGVGDVWWWLVAGF